MRSLILSAVLALTTLALTALPASAYTPRYRGQFHAPYGTVNSGYSGVSYYQPSISYYNYPYNTGNGYYAPSYNYSNSGYYAPYAYNPGYSYYNMGTYGR